MGSRSEEKDDDYYFRREFSPLLGGEGALRRRREKRERDRDTPYHRTEGLSQSGIGKRRRFIISPVGKGAKKKLHP